MQTERVQPAQTEQEVAEINLYVFTNNPKDSRPYSLLQMFYTGAFDNTLGIMEALNKDTDALELLLVGISQEEDGTTNTYPIAKLLDPEELRSYAAPDGRGGYYESAPVKEEGVKSESTH